MDLGGDHASYRAFQDCIRDSADEVGPVAFHTVDTVDRTGAVVAAAAAGAVDVEGDAAAVAVAVVGRKQGHWYHDRMDTSLHGHRNLYFQENHYMESSCIKSLYLMMLLLMVDVSYSSDATATNVRMSPLTNENRSVGSVSLVAVKSNASATMNDGNVDDSRRTLSMDDNAT